MTTVVSTTHAAPLRVNRALLAGAAGGLAGGMAMAMFSMFVAISRDGFWSPVRGIASVVFGDEHYGGGFEFWPIVAGAGGHMMNSVMLGLVFAILAGLILSRAGAAAVMMAGAAYGLGAWAVMVPGLAHALQGSDLSVDSVPQGAWVAGHLMFGAITGLAVAAARRRASE